MSVVKTLPVFALLISCNTLAGNHFTHTNPNNSRTTWAEVTAVEPVTRTRVEAPNEPGCFEPKPAPAAGLRPLLEWDLLVECRPRETTETTHYNVKYTWADRDYSYTSKTLPANRIRIRVGVAPEVD